MNSIGRQYKLLQTSLYWQVYYSVFGTPFMSAHLVYDLILANCHFEKSNLILDYGTGDGLFLNQITKDFGSIGTGIDRLPERINKAKKVSDAQHLNNSFICSNFEDIDLNDKFDKVLCLDVLEHLDNPSLDLQRIAKLLKEDGALIIQTPRDHDHKYILKDTKNTFTYGLDEHKQDGFSLKNLEGLLNRFGFKIKYWQSSFPPLSQIMYEVLEIVRMKRPRGERRVG
jgi:cyclopropane fatty-acyl-phospholipid synthase-like methyltransferase